MGKKFRHSWDSRSEFDRVRKNSKNEVRFVASFYAEIFFACHRHDLVSRLMETSRTGKNDGRTRFSLGIVRVITFAAVDMLSTDATINQHRGKHGCKEVICIWCTYRHTPNVSPAWDRKAFEFLNFLLSFFSSSLVVRFYIHRRACPRFVFRRWWFASNSHVYALIRRSKRKVSRNIRKQNVSSIDRYATPTTISRFIERINYFVTRDKHEQTNFVDTGFIGLLVEFTGRLLV